MSTKSKSIESKTDFNQDERLKKVSNLKILLNRPELGALGGAILVFIFFGIGSGMLQPMINSLLAERYGTKWIGEIKSLAMPLNVIASAALAVNVTYPLPSPYGLSASAP